MKVIQMLPALDSGGVERGTLELSRYLVRHGHESIVISEAGRMLEQLLSEGARHYPWSVGAKRLSSLKWISRVRQLLEDEQPDILHLRSRLPAWIGYLAWRKLPASKRPHLVTTVHGPYTVNRYSAVMTKGERVIAVSNMISRYIEDNYPKVDPAVIRVIHRGVDRDHYPIGFTPEEQWLTAWSEEFPNLHGQFIVTLPARLTRWKGQVDFVRIIAELNRKGVPAYGLMEGGAHKRKQDFASELETQIEQAGMQGKILMLGNRRDLREILAQSDIVLSLSLDPEAFGRTTIEALSLGTPVIGYDHGGVSEQLQAVLPEGRVPVGEWQAVAEKIALWRDQPPEVAPEHPFTLENMLGKTLAVYRELLDD
jgi:glycosyltransferase involved in cell wall biosynthesis